MEQGLNSLAIFMICFYNLVTTFQLIKNSIIMQPHTIVGKYDFQFSYLLLYLMVNVAPWKLETSSLYILIFLQVIICFLN